MTNTNKITSMVSDYNSGKTMSELADIYRMSSSTCAKMLRDAGATIRRAGPAACSAEQRAEMLRLYVPGEAYSHIATLVGICSSATVRRYLEEAGVFVAHAPINPVKLLADYRAGTRVIDLARELGVTRNTVYKALQRHGTPLVNEPTPPRSIHPEAESIAAGIKAGSTAAELASLYFVTRPMVYKIARRHGLKLTRSPRQRSCLRDQ